MEIYNHRFPIEPESVQYTPNQNNINSSGYPPFYYAESDINSPNNPNISIEVINEELLSLNADLNENSIAVVGIVNGDTLIL